MISHSALQEFKRLWLEEFGQELSEKEALEKALSLLAGFDAIYRPIKKEWLPKNTTENQPFSVKL